MNEHQYIEVIENLNLENNNLLSSKEYKLGKFLYEVKKQKFSYFFDFLRKSLVGKKVNKKYVQVNPEYNRSALELKYDRKKMEKTVRVAVYTCVTGNYDKVVEPSFVSDNVDYIIFTDQEVYSNVWRIREIPKSIKSLNNGILINRYIKMHAYELLGNYDYAIYIDGNVKVISDVTTWVSSANNANGFAMHSHYQRICAYQEAEVAKLYKKGDCNKLSEQIEKYKSEGFPRNYGLLEATVIISKLSNTNYKIIMNEWWEEFLRSKSMRDQIALPYVMWKNKYLIEDSSLLGKNLYKSEKIRVIPH